MRAVARIVGSSVVVAVTRALRRRRTGCVKAGGRAKAVRQSYRSVCTRQAVAVSCMLPLLRWQGLVVGRRRRRAVLVFGVRAVVRPGGGDCSRPPRCSATTEVDAPALTEMRGGEVGCVEEAVMSGGHQRAPLLNKTRAGAPAAGKGNCR